MMTMIDGSVDLHHTILIACWTGYDQNQPINRGYPYPSTMLFNTVMNAICADKPAATFTQPSSVTTVRVM